MKRRPASGGFTYLGLIILLAVMGMVAAAGLKMGTLLQRAAAEEELLEIGAQFGEALRSYAAATPQGKPQQPPSLQDLLKDPRFPTIRRHLRKIFVDPVTGKAEWGIVYLGDKVGVIGVYSLSAAKPLKVANFDIRFQNLENREHISDWKFGMTGGEGVQPAVVTPPNSMTGFRPGAASSLFGQGATGQAAGLKDGRPGEAAPAGGKGAQSPAPAPVAPDGSKAVAAAEEPAEEARQEGEPTMEAQSDEEKDMEAARAKEEADEKAQQADSTIGGARLPPGVAPPPENRVRRR